MGCRMSVSHNVSKFDSERGFSLIEVAIGLLILSLVITGLAGVLQSVFEVDKLQKQKQNIQSVQGGITTFLAVNSFLPCPDVSVPPDGREDRTDGRCNAVEGNLPYNDFGVAELDAWGNPYYYRVVPEALDAANVVEICQSASVFGRSGIGTMTNLLICPDTNQFYCADLVACTPGVCPSGCGENTIDPRPTVGSPPIVNSPPYFHLATPPYGVPASRTGLDLKSQDGSLNLNDGVMAIVVSWGVDGDEVFRYTAANNSCAAGAATADELENCDGDSTFHNTITGENRDFITWVTVNQAKMAIIGSGRFQ